MFVVLERKKQEIKKMYFCILSSYYTLILFFGIYYVKKIGTKQKETKKKWHKTKTIKILNEEV
jgi:hypothetical protein